MILDKNLRLNIYHKLICHSCELCFLLMKILLFLFFFNFKQNNSFLD
jgi:hypothetical protein